MTRVLACLLATALLIRPAQAQSSPPLVKYGKWVLAAGAVGMNYFAARSHNRAEDAFDALQARCGDSTRFCDVGPTGRYLDPQSESLFQESLSQDRQARRWLLGGEAALLGAAAMFVWELTRHSPEPDNIPFEPEVTTARGTTHIGLRLGF